MIRFSQKLTAGLLFLLFLDGGKLFAQSDSVLSVDELLEKLRSGEISMETFEEALLSAERSGAELSFVAREELRSDSVAEFQLPLFFNFGSQYSLTPQKDSRNYFAIRSPAKSPFGFFAEGTKTPLERQLTLRRRGAWFAKNGWEAKAGNFEYEWGEGLILGRGFYPLGPASKPDDFSNSIGFPDYTRYNGIWGRRTLEHFSFEAFGSLDQSEIHRDALGAAGASILGSNFQAGFLAGGERLQNRRTAAQKSYPFASLQARYNRKEAEFSGEAGFLDKKPAGYILSATARHGFWISEAAMWNYNSNLLIHSGGPSFGDYRTQEIEAVDFSYRTPRSQTKGFFWDESWRPNWRFSFSSQAGFWGPLGEKLNRYRLYASGRCQPAKKLAIATSWTKSDFSDTLEARQRWSGKLAGDWELSPKFNLQLTGELARGFAGYRGKALAALLRWVQNRLTLTGWGKIGQRTDREADRFYYIFYLEEKLKIFPELEFMARLSHDFNRSLSNSPSTFLRVELARPW